MRGQAIVADARVVHQTACHHEPAHAALQCAKNEDAQQFPAERTVYLAPHQEEQQGDEEQHADQAAQQPVKVLPPEDPLEFRNAHVEVDLPILGCELVLVERLLPLPVGHRWNRSDDRLPLDDGKP